MASSDRGTNPDFHLQKEVGETSGVINNTKSSSDSDSDGTVFSLYSGPYLKMDEIISLFLYV